jgi:hypothetical protein
MARIDLQALEQSALAKMPSGWVTRAELEALLTPDEVKAVSLHVVKDRKLVTARVKPTPDNPLNLVLQYQKVEGGA